MEPSTLDYVAQACMDLTENIEKATTESERDSLINNHIKKVWPIVPPIEDFKKNLEWVNVSQPVYLSQHCLNKVVVLDFWTYCCINCYHALSDLAHLEKLYKDENGLVIIGVHCAKFLNEKTSDNILSAVERYGIHHPVVNDSESEMWNTLGIRCWPTFLILGPENKPVFILTGEGHMNELEWYVGALIQHFKGNNGISSTPIPIAPSKHLKAKDSILYYPSKIALNPFYRGRSDEPYLAIADTGHHRIVLTDCSGIILRIIGDFEPGLIDGNFSEARFNSPQGICWLSSSVLFVCDTNNHSIRAIHLDESTVERVTGTGKQAETGDHGGKCLGEQALSSPWDIILYTTPDMDMSVRTSMPLPTPADKENSGNEKETEKLDERRRVVLIACAGSHQIWALFLDNTIWWKYKTYSEGVCVRIAGTGSEAARNSAYPHTAAFAQPSGLTLKSGGSPEVFIADSESSSIRRLALASGHVSTLCGGDRNPLNLFAYGDVDDIGIEAKLQHPLAVAYSEANKTLYIADTYNNKIKKVDIGPQKVTTISSTMIESANPVQFNEPSGLSASQDGKYLYIADTNNHSIKILNIAKNACQEFRVRVSDAKFIEPDNLILYKNDLFVNRKYGNLIIHFTVSLENDIKKVKFTSGARQNWRVCIRNAENEDVTTEDFEFIGCSSKGSTLPGRVEMKLKSRTENTHYRLYLSFVTALCDGSLCFTHSFTIRSMILVRDSVKMIESYRITCKVNPINKTQS